MKRLVPAIGTVAVRETLITQDKIALMADVIEDKNPLHLDEQFAERTRFGRRIAHGAFSSGLISAVLGNQLPGPGTIYISQRIDFLAPVFIGDKLRAVVTLVDWNSVKNTAKLTTNCYVGEKITARGEAVVLYETGNS